MHQGRDKLTARGVQTLYNDCDGAEGLYDAAIQLDPGHWPSYGFKVRGLVPADQASDPGHWPSYRVVRLLGCLGVLVRRCGYQGVVPADAAS